MRIKKDRRHDKTLPSQLAEVITHGRIARRIEDMDAATLHAITTATMSPEHDALNALLDDWNEVPQADSRLER